MRNLVRKPIVSVLLVVIAVGLAVGIGVTRAQWKIVSRGIPKELPEPVDGGGVRPAINVALEQYTDAELDQALESIREAGFGTLKQSFYYDSDYDWSLPDRLLAAVERHNLQLVPLLDGNPNNEFAPPRIQNTFASWVKEFANRYGHHVQHYVIWDEPNLTSHWGGQDVNPAEYGALLSAAASAIRSADPDAVIVAAPLAPTVETGPKNLADSLYLQELYEVGADESFDIVAGKPYGFNTGPDDRDIDFNVLNFSHIVLLREVMERNNDSAKPIWAGNWGWNSLPTAWIGSPSIWGEVYAQQQAEWTSSALHRARTEWPWMGHMFLENWEPAAQAEDPRWGFSIANNPQLQKAASLAEKDDVAYPGFHMAEETDPAQLYQGSWRFSEEFGADVGESGDSLEFTFWGTDVGLRVRRANYHSRFYVEVDKAPANDLPFDDQGSVLVLNSPDPAEDYLSIEQVASNLKPGIHTLTLTALRGSDQWALNGISVLYSPDYMTYRSTIAILSGLLIATLIILVWIMRQLDWSHIGQTLASRYSKLTNIQQIFLAAIGAAFVTLGGFLTYGEQAASIYRRLGDAGQLTLTAATAGLFYASPSFAIYLTALAILFTIIYLRPVWGLVLVAFCFPFFIKPKPIAGFQFSPVEIFLAITLAAFTLRIISQRLANRKVTDPVEQPHRPLLGSDYSVVAFALVATISLLFTARLDVATNEWRVLIIEPAIFYLLMRKMRISDRELWTIIDAFILGGIAVAVIGLWQYATGQNLITSEGGLMRLRSVYGSPNNVALYLGRIIPIVIAVILMGKGSRRRLYLLALIPLAFAIGLSYSKGALFLGLPASLLVILILWRRSVGGRLWPWLAGVVAAGLIALLIAFQIPALAGRLNPQGATGFFRMNLWLSSINMFKDHPIIGVGLDNFLYEYRGRYILDAAWQEPNLSHPHNLILDFSTRLGLLGLITGLWMFWSYLSHVLRLIKNIHDEWRPIVVGLLSSLVYIVAHGIVDHSFFLVDLAYAFMFLLGIAAWLTQKKNREGLPS